MREPDFLRNCFFENELPKISRQICFTACDPPPRRRRHHHYFVVVVVIIVVFTIEVVITRVVIHIVAATFSR